jgi:hypothetical protein
MPALPPAQATRCTLLTMHTGHVTFRRKLRKVHTRKREGAPRSARPLLFADPLPSFKSGSRSGLQSASQSAAPDGHPGLHRQPRPSRQVETCRWDGGKPSGMNPAAGAGCTRPFSAPRRRTLRPRCREFTRPDASDRSSLERFSIGLAGCSLARGAARGRKPCPIYRASALPAGGFSPSVERNVQYRFARIRCPPANRIANRPRMGVFTTSRAPRLSF